VLTSSQKIIKVIPQAIWQDNLSRRGIATAVFLWLAGLLLLVFFWLRLPPQVPLFFSLPWGEEQLVSPISIFLLPGGVITVILINLLCAIFLSREKLILRALCSGSAICAFLGLYAIIKILEISL
jgi:hypothetical protein